MDELSGNDSKLILDFAQTSAVLHGKIMEAEFIANSMKNGDSEMIQIIGNAVDFYLSILLEHFNKLIGLMVIATGEKVDSLDILKKLMDDYSDEMFSVFKEHFWDNKDEDEE